jgi:hypothetical protein
VFSGLAPDQISAWPEPEQKRAVDNSSLAAFDFECLAALSRNSTTYTDHSSLPFTTAGGQNYGWKISEHLGA